MAMKEQCKQSVAKALGKDKLSAQEATDIENRIRDTMKNLARQDIDAWRNMSDTEKLTAAGKQVAIDIQEQLKRKHKIAAQDIIKQSQNLSALDHATLPASEVIDRMIAPHGDMSGIQSIDSKARAIGSIYRGQLVDLFTDIKGKLGVFTDNELVQRIIRERFGESTGDAQAKNISDKMGEVFENMRQRFNRSGGDIGKLDDWGLPQNHSLEKIAKSGKDTWINNTQNLINPEKYVHEDGSYYSQDQLKTMLENAYDTLVSDGANKLEIGRQSHGGTSKATNKHSESRVLHFKDADSWLEYQHEYGGMPFVELVEAHVNGLSKDIALVENLGSNPKSAMYILMDSARNKDWSNGVDHQNTDKTLKRAQVMFDEFNGQNSPQSQVLANVGLAYRSMNVASMLGGTTIASISDQATIAKTAQVHGIAYHETFGEMIKNLNPKNGEDRKLAHSLGIATEEMLGALNRFADDGLTSVHGKAEKIAKLSNSVANQVMRVSFLNALTAASKMGFTKMLMDKYGRLTRDTNWKDLHADDRELLEKTGLNEKAWQVMQLAEPVVDRSGNQLMSSRSIYEIPDEKLTAFGDPHAVRDEVATQLQAHLLDEQGLAVIEAGIRERTWLTAGVRKGTPIGEIIKCMTQFKSFPAAFMMRQGSRIMAQKNGISKAKYGISLFLMSTVLGGLVVQLKELLNGNDPQTVWSSQEPSKFLKFFSRSVVQGGGLGVIGDIVSAGTDPSGRGMSEWISGVGGSDAKTLMGVTVGNLNQWYEGKDTNAANEAYMAFKNKIPAQNLWYTKAAVNKLIFDQMQDMIAPGYRDKLKRKAEREQGRTSWWGDLTDVQAPDFEKVVQ